MPHRIHNLMLAMMLALFTLLLGLGGYDQHFNKTTTWQDTATRNAKLYSATAGFLASSGKGENVSSAASIGASGFENNYLKHTEALELTVAKSGCESGDYDACTRVLELEKLYEQRLLKIRACEGSMSADCVAARKELTFAVADYAENRGANLTDMSLLDAVDYTYFEADAAYQLLKHGTDADFSLTEDTDVIGYDSTGYISDSARQILENPLSGANGALLSLASPGTALNSVETAHTSVRSIPMRKPFAIGIKRDERIQGVQAGANRTFTKENAFETIDKFRSHKGGLDELGDSIPIKGDGQGTVAFVDVGGKPIFGVNSSALVRDVDKNLGRSWAKTLGLKYGQGTGQYLTHGEAHSLMRAYDKTGGSMPSSVNMFVDRYSCSFCRDPKALPDLAQRMGIKNLNLTFKDGSTAVINNGRFIQN